VKQIWVKKLFLYVKRRIKNFSYRKALVFLVCLALATFLWLLNSLEKHYTGRISIPIRYVDFPKDRQISGSLPRNFDLVVDAYGYTLLSYKLLLPFSPIQINVSELIENVWEMSPKDKYTISTRNHLAEIEKQISSEIRILSIKPDSLVFNFSKIISRKIKVRPDIKLNFENQYSLENEPFTYPDSLLVSGPKNILDTLKYVYTNYREFTKVSRTLEQKIGILSPKGLKTDKDEVRITIPVEQNTEVTFEVPIQIINSPPDIIVKTFPGKVKVACRIGLSKYKKLDYSTFRATINYKTITGNDTRLPVTFESHSDVVMAFSYSPKEVEYILEQKK
jgi:YbbR domain-containing protein